MSKLNKTRVLLQFKVSKQHKGTKSPINVCLSSCAMHQSQRGYPSLPTLAFLQYLPTRGTNLLPFFDSCGLCSFWPCLPLMIPAIDLLLDFCDDFSQYQLTQKTHTEGRRLSLDFCDDFSQYQLTQKTRIKEGD